MRGHALRKPILWEGSPALVSTALVLVQLRFGGSHRELPGRPRAVLKKIGVAGPAGPATPS